MSNHNHIKIRIKKHTPVWRSSHNKTETINRWYVDYIGQIVKVTDEMDKVYITEKGFVVKHDAEIIN